MSGLPFIPPLSSRRYTRSSFSTAYESFFPLLSTFIKARVTDPFSLEEYQKHFEQRRDMEKSFRQHSSQQYVEMMRQLLGELKTDVDWLIGEIESDSSNGADDGMGLSTMGREVSERIGEMKDRIDRLH